MCLFSATRAQAEEQRDRSFDALTEKYGPGKKDREQIRSFRNERAAIETKFREEENKISDMYLRIFCVVVILVGIISIVAIYMKMNQDFFDRQKLFNTQSVRV